MRRWVMQKRIALHQEFEKWKAKATLPIVPCHISRAKLVSVDSDLSSCQLLVEGLHQTWRVERRFRDFQVLSFQLAHAFPAEAGKRGHERILPECPIPKKLERLFRGRATFDVSLKDKVDAFCHQLLSLPPYISRSRLVLEFFLPRSADATLTLFPLRRSLSLESMSLRTGSICSESSESAGNRNFDDEPVLVKVALRGRMALFEHDGYEGGLHLLERIRTRLPTDGTTLSLHYFDDECDKIHVEDVEDLEIAMIILGKSIVLHSN